MKSAEEIDKYEKGADCKCASISGEECACGADWTPKEVYELLLLLSKVDGFAKNSNDYVGSKLHDQVVNKLARE